MASTTIGGPTVSEWDKRTLFASWLDIINVDETYDYVIFDCPPATKLVCQNALAASDYFVIPVIPDEVSSRGVTHFCELVKNKIDAKLEYLRNNAGISESETPKSYIPSTKISGIVPFMAKPAGAAHSGLINLHTRQIKTLRRQWNDMLLNTVVKNMAGVAESIDKGWPVWDLDSRNATGDVIAMMKNACKEIEERI